MFQRFEEIIEQAEQKTMTEVAGECDDVESCNHRLERKYSMLNALKVEDDGK